MHPGTLWCSIPQQGGSPRLNNVILLLVSRAEQEATAKNIDFGVQANVAIELVKVMFSEPNSTYPFCVLPRLFDNHHPTNPLHVVVIPQISERIYHSFFTRYDWMGMQERSVSRSSHCSLET
jgi:hypothetical protein